MANIDNPLSPSGPIAAGTNMIGQVEVAPSATPGLPYQASIAAGSTVATISPAANSLLQRLNISITGDAAQATAGEVIVTVALNGGTVDRRRVYVPLTALGTGILASWDMNFSDAEFSAGPSGTLTVTLGNALTAGTVSINALFA